MLKISQTKIAKSISLKSQSNAKIVSHRFENNVAIFKYSIELGIDTAQAEKIEGDVKLRVFSSKKRESQISVKKSSFFSQNMFKAINQQKISQRNEIIKSRRYIAEKFICKNDLSNKQVVAEIEISSGKIDDTFYVEIVSVRIGGSTQVINSFEINHKSCLEKYDLPGDNFIVTLSQSGYDEIVVAAVSEDEKIGAFRFFIKNDSGTGFESSNFIQAAQTNVETSNIATARISVKDNSLNYIVRASPVSLILSQQIGNFKETASPYVKNLKKIPFYMSRISDDSASFKICQIDKSIKQILLYKQSAIDLERKFVTSILPQDSSLEGTVITDSNRNPYYDFIYTVDYQDESGSFVTSPGEVYVPALKLDKIAKISVQKSKNPDQKTPTKIETNPRKMVSFNVRVEYDLTSPFDQIVEDIKSLNLYDTFSQDLEKMTNNLKSLTRVLVSKISYATGDEEYLGTYPAGIITVPNYDGGKSIYRFEVAVKSAPAALENMAASQSLLADNAYSSKNFSDLTSKKIGNKFNSGASNFSSKFLSRSSITQSTLKYGNSADLGDIGYYEGRTGIFCDSTVSETSSGIAASVSQIETIKGDTGNYLRWRIVGDYKKITEFKIRADGKEFFCMPSRKQTQIFYIGNNTSNNVSITPIFSNQSLNSSDKESEGVI